jgi:uncharacterized membrane protein
MLVFYAGICTVSLTISAGFALMGAWLILPFAGLEMLALGIALYLSAVRAAQREVISIDKNIVEISRGRYRPEQSCRFQRAWVRISFRPTASDWHRNRLTIGSHGREVEVGAMLSNNERESLARELRRAIGWDAGVAGMAGARI